jgi:protein subunit release factor A
MPDLDSKDLIIEEYSANGGPSLAPVPAVLITHKPTGIAVTAAKHREQYRNVRDALAELSRRLEAQT